MSKKKLAVVGQGSVGCLTVAYFLAKTNWDIDWYFTSDVAPLSVGEGTSLRTPDRLYEIVNFQHSDLFAIKGTPKQGVYKKHWTKNDSDYLHPFPVIYSAIHFDAVELQKYLVNKVQEFHYNRVQMIDQYIDRFEDLEADHVMVCTGKPKHFDDNYIMLDQVPVNASYIVQCDWQSPRFTYTLSNAAKYGWIFGIPLQHRISLGYMYNDKLNDIADIKKDIANILQEYNLTPNGQENHFNFQSFYRKENFSNKVVYNGFASYFIEALEATTITVSDTINELALDLWTGNKDLQECQNVYSTDIKETLSMILLHYLSGSIYESDFWAEANTKATEWFTDIYKDQTRVAKFMHQSLDEPFLPEDRHLTVGHWQSYNYNLNIKTLGLEAKIRELYNTYFGGDEIESN